MGYATQFYAVDIEALKSAVGSQDTRIIDRVRDIEKSHGASDRQVDPTKGSVDQTLTDLIAVAKAIPEVRLIVGADEAHGFSRLTGRLPYLFLGRPEHAAG